MLRKFDTEALVGLVKRLVKYAIPQSAQVVQCKENENYLQVESKWTQRDLERLQNVVTVRTFVINKTDQTVVSSSLPVELNDEQLSAFSPDGKLRAVIRKQSGKESEEKYLFEVVKAGAKFVNVDLQVQEKHLKVYNDGTFGCFEWSPSQDQLLYVAEKYHKEEPLFKASKPKSADVEGKNAVEKGDQYLYRQDWGENLVGKHHPVVCIVNLTTEEVQQLDPLPDDVSCGQAIWTPDGKGVVFVGWSNQPRRLGLIACNNRKSLLYHYDMDTKKCAIIDNTDGENFSVRSPRFSPDGQKLVYLKEAAGGPHRNTCSLCLCEWPSKKIRTVVDIVRSDAEFPGLYVDSIPRHSWTSDSNRLVLDTIWHSKSELITIDVADGKIVRLTNDPIFGFWEVLSVKDDIIVAVRSSPSIAPHLVIAKLPAAGLEELIKWTTLDEDTTTNTLKWEIISLKPVIEDRNANYPKLDYEAILVSPTTDGTEKRPLLVCPHGGPHSTIHPSYAFTIEFFTSLGFDMLFVNYRGSLGFGQDSIDSLLGNIGKQDVADVQTAVSDVLQRGQYDSKNIVIKGGSHGGYLVVSIIGQHLKFYKAAIALNPVTDIVSMHTISDIPDWSFVESGIHYDDAKLASREDLEIMWTKSPINLVDKIQTPLLLMLGSKDQRVPYSQGLQLYHALKARSADVKAFVYEDGHQLGKVEVEADNYVNMGKWVMNYISPK